MSATAYPTTKTLHRQTLTLARIGLILMAAISLGWFILNVPFAYRLVRDTVTPLQDPQLIRFGLSPERYAAYSVGLDVLFVGLCTAVSLTLFRRRADDPMALLTATALVVWGVFNGLINQTAEALGAPVEMEGWPRLLMLLAVAGYMSWMLFFYLFPSFEFVPRWTRLTAFGWVLFTGSWAAFPESSLAPPNWPGWLFGPVVLSLWASFVVAQIHRYRRVSNHEQRLQTKWVVFGVALAVAGFMPSVLLVGTVFEVPLSDVRRHMLVQLLSVGFISLIPLSVGIAVLRYRLYDIDIIINRTLVYSALTLLIVALYTLMVTALGMVFQAQGNFAIALAATGAVAVLFQPLRERVQKGVNRLMFGQRDDPVGMLTLLAQRLEAVDTSEAVLPTLVETIATSLKLPYVALEVGPEKLAESGRRVGQVQRLPLVYQHRKIGRLAVAPRSPQEAFSPADERLLATIASLTATTVWAVQLGRELQASRQLLVTSREEERRRVRRDLHDGLGPVLAAVAMQADTARDLVDTDTAESIALLTSILELAQDAVEDVRRVVHDLRPPALDELGLVNALRQTAQTHRHQMHITVEAPDPLPTLSAAVEVAAYRISQEAVNNAVRHAQARTCVVEFSMDDRLHLTVTDDGVGIPDSAPAGVGLTSMRERAAELGGRFSIRRLPERGTQIQVSLPLSQGGVP